MAHPNSLSDPKDCNGAKRDGEIYLESSHGTKDLDFGTPKC